MMKEQESWVTDDEGRRSRNHGLQMMKEQESWVTDDEGARVMGYR